MLAISWYFKSGNNLFHLQCEIKNTQQMKKIVIIYGSSTGTTQAVAEAIASRLDVKDVFDVATITKGQVEPYDVLILGTSTWGDGELQDDWNDGINVIKSVNLAGKDVALFGCGDSMAYSDTFCNGMHLLKEELEGTGCNFIGGIPADGYSYSDSTAVEEGEFIGAAIDDNNEPEKTGERIDTWLASFKDRL